jgi:hypothetical protein
VRGYARYALNSVGDDHGTSCGQVLLRDLETLDTAAYGAVCAFSSAWI